MTTRFASSLSLLSGLFLALTLAACGSDRAQIVDLDGSTDTGGGDAGGTDAGRLDAGQLDAGNVDAGDIDAGDVDAGDIDAGDVDAGDIDAGDVDAGDIDAGGLDAGDVDAGDFDAGAVDAGDIDAGGSCDDGNPCTVDTFIEGEGCSNVPGNEGTECHASTGGCDPAETCTGGSAECPSDTGVSGEGTVCRASTGLCDVAETCSGGSAICPDDAAALTPYLYGATGGSTNSNLYILNADGSTASTVGSLGVAITGLAVHPITRVLYGVTTTMSPAHSLELITIDPATAAITAIGALGGVVADITFDADGTLYGWSEATDDLATISLTTGAATPISDSTLDTYGSGLAFSLDGRLFYTGFGNNADLVLINKITGLQDSVVATLSGAPGSSGDSINALTVHPITGALLGVNNSFGSGPSYLMSIDTSTAVITSLGMSLNRLDGIAYLCR